MMDALRLVMLGPPGSGKGTVAKNLASRLGVPHLSTGDMLRSAAQKGTPVGTIAKPYMDAGTYVPDGVIIDLLVERVVEPDCKAGFLLDGFPRTLPQAEALEGRGLGPVAVVHLRVSDAEVTRRLTGRRVCGACGQPYHIDFLPEGDALPPCEKCGGALMHRDDDCTEVVVKRLETYKVGTAPLVDFYAERVVDVDGQQAPSAVLDSVINGLQTGLGARDAAGQRIA